MLCQSNLPFLRSGEPSWGDDAALSSNERVDVVEEGAGCLDGVEVEAKDVARLKVLEEDEVERKSVPKMSR